ncbi:phosphopantetheine-binding protein [Azotobacter sp. CWF10]
MPRAGVGRRAAQPGRAAQDLQRQAAAQCLPPGLGARQARRLRALRARPLRARRRAAGGRSCSRAAALRRTGSRPGAALAAGARRGGAPDRQAHFFAGGGNSLAAVRLAALVGERWAIDFPARLLFERPRFEELVAEIRNAQARGGGQPKRRFPSCRPGAVPNPCRCRTPRSASGSSGSSTPRAAPIT